MLKVDNYGRIRRAARDGLSERAIARLFGHSRRTVRKALAQAEPQRYTLSSPRPAPVLEPVQAAIDRIRADDEQAPPKQRHTAMQVYRRLVAEHGYTGSYTTVRRYLASQEEGRQERFIPLDHAPGERLEADFGHLHVDLPGGRCLVPVFVCTWGYSNAVFALALPTERTEAVLAGMVAAFEFYGCVPREVWWDNPRTIAVAILAGRERRLHERYQALASFYCFEPCACMPRQAHEKGRVEGRVKDLQRRFATPVPKAKGLRQLNEDLREWCLADRERTIRGAQGSIGERFAAEEAAALALPPAPFEPVVYQPASVDKYQQARFDNVFYSVPARSAFGTVTIRASVDRVEVLKDHQVIASHPRCYEAHAQVLDPLHYLTSLERRPAALDQARCYREWQLPPAFGQLREALELRHGPRAGRRLFIGVLQLLVEHPQELVSQTVERHLARGDLDTGALRLAVERRRLTEHAPLAPFPQVEVPLPDLRRFDQLLYPGGTIHA